MENDGVHNINFVTPDHFWPQIEFVTRTTRSQGFSLPFLFNSSGYQIEEMIPRYAEWMDIFLPDFKFAQAGLTRYCMGDARYPEIALAAVRRMVEIKGFLHPWNPEAREPARTGVLVRHLILPGHVENSLLVLRQLRHEFGPRIPLSVFSMYLCNRVSQQPNFCQISSVTNPSKATDNVLLTINYPS